MSSLLWPLLCRTDLFDGESLPSFLARLAILNAINPPKLLYDLCLNQVPHPKDEHFDAPVNPLVLENISVLSGIEVNRLFHATKHNFDYLLINNNLIYLNHTSRFEIFTQRIQYCPYCLLEQAYHRLIWMLRLMAACPKHHCLLLEYCFHCCHSISLESIVKAKCSYCQEDLTLLKDHQNQTVISIENPDHHTIHLLLQDIIENKNLTEHMPSGGNHFTISSLSSLFSLINNIQDICIERGMQWIHESSLLSTEYIIEEEKYFPTPLLPQKITPGNNFINFHVKLRYYSAIIANKIFLGGKGEWKNFLLAYQLPFEFRQSHSLSNSFGLIYDHLVLQWQKDLSLTCIYNASIEFLIENPLIPISREECISFQNHYLYGHLFTLIPLEDIADEMGFSWIHLYRFILIWSLSVGYINDNLKICFRKSIILLLNEKLDISLTNQEVSSVLEIPLQYIQYLRDHTNLVCAKDVLVWGGSFLRSIHPICQQNDDLISIRSATSMVPKQKNQFISTILWCIQNTVIEAYTDAPYEDLHRIYIKQSDLQTVLPIFSEECKKQRFHVPVDSAMDLIAIDMIPDRYGIPVDIAREWIHLGYLQSWSDGLEGGNTLFSEATFQALLADPPSITARDLAWLWGILPTQVITWEQTGLLETLRWDGDLFIYPSWDYQTRMEEFTRLHIPEQIYFTRLSNATCVQKIAGWLTTDEVSQQLQIQPSVVYQSYVTKTITPVARCRSVIYFDKDSLKTLAYHLEQKATKTPKASKGNLQRKRRRS